MGENQHIRPIGQKPTLRVLSHGCRIFFLDHFLAKSLLKEFERLLRGAIPASEAEALDLRESFKELPQGATPASEVINQE